MTRRTRAIAVAALCVAALAGCTAPTRIVDPPPSTGFHLAQIGGGPVTEDRRIKVDRTSSPPDNAYEWTIPAVDPASSRLQLFYTDGACTNADRLSVQETATTVVIGISASKHFDGNCIAVGLPRTTTLTLQHPLGGRALMEGATGVNDGLPKVHRPSSLPDPRCSRLDGSASDVPVGMPGAATRMAPAAATTAFVCRTWWPKGSAHAESTTITDAAKVRALVRAVNAGTQGIEAGVPIADCPVVHPHASRYDVTVQGPGVRVEVRTDAISCDIITNGAAGGTVTPALIRTLDALFPS